MTMMQTTRHSRRWGLAGLAATVAVGVLATTAPTAAAHVSVSSSSVTAGSYAVLAFSVPHGCEGSPTTEVAIQIPETVGSVTPTRHPLYSLEVVTETLDEPVVDGHGNELTERVSEVVYTASDPLPDGQRDVLEISVRLPVELAESTLYFPTVQTCASGETAWIEVPADGQDPHDLAHPAPSLQVVPESEEDPAGSSGDALAWTGLGLGALGTVLGGGALVASRRR